MCCLSGGATPIADKRESSVVGVNGEVSQIERAVEKSEEQKEHKCVEIVAETQEMGADLSGNEP